MNSENDQDCDCQIEQIDKTTYLKPREIYQSHQGSLIVPKRKDKFTSPLNKNIEKLLKTQKNLSHLNCVKFGNCLLRDLQSMFSLQTGLTPYIIFQQVEIRSKIERSISAMANQGGGTIVIVKQYEKNFIKGFPNDLMDIYKQSASKWIQNDISKISGNRFIQSQIDCITIFRSQQFALIITIKVDQQERKRGRIFLFQQVGYILVKNIKSNQFQIQPDNQPMMEGVVKLNNSQQIICECIHSFTKLRENKFLNYQISQQLADDPRKFFIEVCRLFSKYGKNEDYPDIKQGEHVLILKIHEHHGQQIIKDILEIFYERKIIPEQYFPAKQLQYKVRKFKQLKNPRAFYYQIRYLVFPNVNFKFSILDKLLKEKLKEKEKLFKYKLLSSKISIRESLSLRQMNQFFTVLKQRCNFEPILGQHYHISNDCLKQMKIQDKNLMLFLILVLSAGNKQVFE